MSKPKTRTGIGDSPKMHTIEVNDITYEYWTQDHRGLKTATMYRLTGVDDEHPGHEGWTAGFHQETRSCWRVSLSDRCWRTLEQAVVELAKRDQGVTYAR